MEQESTFQELREKDSKLMREWTEKGQEYTSTVRAGNDDQIKNVYDKWNDLERELKAVLEEEKIRGIETGRSFERTRLASHEQILRGTLGTCMNNICKIQKGLFSRTIHRLAKLRKRTTKLC